MSNSIVRAEFEMFGMLVSCYKDVSTGMYYLNQNQVSVLTSVPETNIRRFLTSDSLKALLPEGFSIRRLEFKDTTQGGKARKLVDVTTIAALIQWATLKGNQKAALLGMALMRESLEIRAKVALGEIKDEGVLETLKETNARLLVVSKELEKEKNYYQTGMVKANMRASQTRKAAAKVSNMRRLHGEIMQARGAKREKLEKEFYGIADGTIEVNYRSLDELAPVEVPEICNF